MSLAVERITSLSEIDPAEWQPLVPAGNPFVEHSFLRLLEESGSVGPPETGWRPVHLVAREAGALVGAMPLYLKDHSYGEFIFDFGWANAAYRAGISYYPKLVCAVPFTPAGGRRVLTAEAASRKAVAAALIDAARSLTLTLRASSLHVLFCDREDAGLLEGLGLHTRRSTQYHFENTEGFTDFAQFLAALRNSSRKNVRRERERARSYGLELSMRAYAELDAGDREAMWTFYRSTVDNFGSPAYLTRAFFEQLAESPHAFAAMAHEAGRPIAGALFFWKDQELFGRYWGTHEERPMLHFELCYYLPMEWGFARGMRRFEAGAQGEHKIRRGLLPCTCFSGHWAAHPGLDLAIADFVQREQAHVEREQALLQAATPFRRS